MAFELESVNTFLIDKNIPLQYKYHKNKALD